MNTFTCCYFVLEDKRNRSKNRQVWLWSPMLSPSPLVKSSGWDAPSLVSGVVWALKTSSLLNFSAFFILFLSSTPFQCHLSFMCPWALISMSFTPCCLTQGRTKFIFHKQIKPLPQNSRKLDHNKRKPLSNHCSWMYFLFSHPLILVVS